jgi:2'-hydroxyisoflavone reductase
MRISRRDVLKMSGAASLGLSIAEGLSSTALAAEPTSKPLRILILGGTGFIGPHQVAYARARGHALTLFNRGKTDPGRFPDIETLHGDRARGDYASLKGRNWDVVIDNPASIPRWVRQAAEALKGHVQHYVFISTVSVYAHNDVPHADETAETEKAPDPTSEDVPKYYGALKALCEQEAERAFPGHATVLRPGLIVGPGDPTDRFTYWPARFPRGGEVLAPGDPTDPVMFIDARDLAEFCVRLCESHTAGTYNCVGPSGILTVSEMLGGIRAVTVSDAYLTWVPAAFLEQHKVNAWTDLPVWVPPSGDSAGFHRRDIRRALAKGITFRPLAVTAKDSLDGFMALSDARKAKPRAGLSSEREKSVLAEWHAQNKSEAVK